MSVISRCIKEMLKGYLCSFLLLVLFPQMSQAGTVVAVAWG